MKISQSDLKVLSLEEKRDLLKRQLKHRDVEVEGTEPNQKGYVTIAHADGTVEQRPYTEALTEYYKPGSLPKRSGLNQIGIRPRTFRFPMKLFGNKPVQERTPRARAESLTRRYVKEWKRGILNERLLQEIAGEFWKEGTPITTETLRQVAQRELQKVEKSMKART